MTLSDAVEARRSVQAPLRNWGRWGPDDQRGAVNLIDDAKRVRAASLVTQGISISLSRVLDVEPRVEDEAVGPRLDYQAVDHGEWYDGLVDYLGVHCHGYASTHIDALCHLWDGDGMYNGWPSPVSPPGHRVSRGGIEQWREGIVTRGVVLDVAATRPSGFVDIGSPVTGDDLAYVARVQGVTVEPGDALAIYCGRDRWESTLGRMWGSEGAGGELDRPGLDSSCIEYFHSVDCSTIVWDMMDVRHGEMGTRIGPHAAINVLGLALVDNADLGPLAARCAELARTDFMLMIAPLVVTGATGSLVNPIALL